MFRAASAWASSGFVSGARKPTTVAPSGSRAISSDERDEVGASEGVGRDRRARLLVGGVGDVRGRAGARLDRHDVPLRREAADDVGHHRHAPLPPGRFVRDTHTHCGGAA